MKKIINQVKILTKNINKCSIDEHATSCAYYTILAFIPLLILILTLTKYFGIDEKFLINILDGIIPGEILNDAVISIVKEVNSKSIGTITISVIITLWSAGKGFYALCKGLSSAFEVEYNYEFIQFRIRGIIATIIFIISVVLTLLLLVFGNVINTFLQEKFNIFSKLINILLNTKILIGIVFLTIVLSIMYRFIPKHKYKFKNQIPGAVIAAVACNIVSIFYSIYVEVFSGFSLMYGSLTTIVLVMLWIYACMYSILIGAVINNLIVKKGKCDFSKSCKLT